MANNICIGTINLCNLECIMCQQHNKELRKKVGGNGFFDKKQVLDASAVYRVIDYLAEDVQFDTTLSFVATGEILLDKRLPDFIAYGKSKGIPRIAIITNGVLLEEQCIRLLDAGLNSITISIDGATPETYYKIRGTDLAQVERGVRKSVEYARVLNARGANIEIWLNCVLVEGTQVASERELYVEKWSDCRDIIKTLRFIKEANYRESDDPLLARLDNYDDGYVCSMPWKAEVTINCYGDVTPCCNMSVTSYTKNATPTPIGNVLKTEDFNEIWNSPKAMELRKEFLRCDFKHFKYCRTCLGKYLDNSVKMVALHSEYKRNEN